jgi:hypothetical protein
MVFNWLKNKKVYHRHSTITVFFVKFFLFFCRAGTKRIGDGVIEQR